jgi:DEAD/DEAH box helicase domain-containing protein
VGASDAAWFTTVGVAGQRETRSPAGERIDPEHAGAQFQPTVFLYDGYPGGIGLSAPLFDLRARVLCAAQAMVGSCACAGGCPACIGPVLAADEQCDRSPKDLALRILSLLADGGEVLP